MDKKFLKTAIQAAKAAEEVIIKHFSVNGFPAELKNDNSPVTIADKEAEKIIQNIILKEYPDHGFLGEETGESNADSEYTWIVDPIDGTRNFSRGIPHFGTLIALMKNNEVILGVSNLPATKELLYAEKGKGAFVLDGTQVTVSKTESLAIAYISSGSLKYFSKTNNLDNLVSLIEKVNGAHGFGDSWAYHFLAQGNLDAVLETKVSIWDIAALKIIIEEAGGRVTDLYGEEVTKSTKTVLATNGILHNEILNYFKAK